MSWKSSKQGPEFPQQKVFELLEELFGILSVYFWELWEVLVWKARLVQKEWTEVSSKCLEDSRAHLLNLLRDGRDRIPDFWNPHFWVVVAWNRFLRLCDSYEHHGRLSRILLASKHLLWDDALGRLLKDLREWIPRLPLWKQGVLFLSGCGLIHLLCFGGVSKRYRKKKRQHWKKKEGQSRILHGRTSLVYGSAGDLKDDAYLSEPKESNPRGRFGTFDFFGIHTPKTNRPAKNRHKTWSGGGDDHLFGIGTSPRKRMGSMDSLGNPAMVLRPRTDSTGSLKDTFKGTFGGFFQSLRKGSAAAAALPCEDLLTPTISNQATIRKSRPTTPRLRKERLGSMDVYFAPGKQQPSLTPRQCKAFQQDDYYESGGRNPHTKAINEFFSDDYEPGFKSLTAERYYYPRRHSSEEYDDHYSGATTGYESTSTSNENEPRYLYDEFGVVTLSHRVQYQGPAHPLLECGSTLVPPPSFEVLSRKIDSSEIDLPLQRILRLNVLEGSLHIIEPTTTQNQNGKWDVVYRNLAQISIKIHSPPEGGVLSFYHKTDPTNHWNEHTFASSHEAAQFQLDFLAYQVLGKPLQHIFESLHLVHQGSLTCVRQELVLHDTVRKKHPNNDDEHEKDSKNPPKQCIAWDDAMRAMSSIPTVRIALERLWLSHRKPAEIRSPSSLTKEDVASKEMSNGTKAPVDQSSKTDVADGASMLKEEYVKHRLLLGPVDFFRLFVPTLPETAIPEGNPNNRGRMEQLLSWRKRVARAAVLVRSYTRARLVANQGWNLSVLADGTESVTKRFAYDGNENNIARDITARNEIYEASVSRDVLCHVRPYDYLIHAAKQRGEYCDDVNDDDDTSDFEDDSEKHLVLSPYQAYTYVDSHYFKVTDELLEEGGPLHPSRDPVDMFPSLQEVIAKHPGLDFFVDCISDPEKNVLAVNLHVRSLAKGIDPQFDNVIERFSNAPEESRNRKLYLMFQMGTSMGLSFFGWLCLKLLSFYFRLTETGRDSPMNLESTRDRYGFPGFQVGGLFRTYHFGGSLQTDPSKPKNYIGLTKCVAASYQESFFAKVLFAKLQSHFIESTVDYTYVIEGERSDELPERALSTLRIVHVDPEKVAKDPRPHIAPLEADVHATTVASEDEGLSSFSPRLLQGAVQYSIDSMRSLVQLGESRIQMLSPQSPSKNGAGLEIITELDETGTIENLPPHLKCQSGRLDHHVERGVDLIIDILRSVFVPCRHSAKDFDPDSLDQWDEEAEATELMVVSKVPILRLFDRNDIARYLQHFDYDLAVAAQRLTESAVWRGQTFPIDIRRCRIELQNGQFFHQGFDSDHNPVFYFRNLCRGPWRGDVQANIMAILYRFDKELSELCKTNPQTKVTLIVLMGHAKKGARKKLRRNSKRGSSFFSIEDDYVLDEEQTPDEGLPPEERIFDIPTEDEVRVNAGNPRISTEEQWSCHTNKELWEELFKIFIWHYPGRFSNLFLVKGRGRNHYYRDHVRARMMVRRLISEARVADHTRIMKKIRFVTKTSELLPFIPLPELPTILGGIAPIAETSYAFG